MKKQLLSYFITILLVLSSCSSKEVVELPRSSDEQIADKTSEVGQSNLKDGTTQTTEIEEQSILTIEDMDFEEGDNEVAPISTYDLIEQDFEAGKISQLEAVDLKLQSMFNEGSIPEAYQVDHEEFEDSFHAIQGEYQWLYDNWESLSSDEQEHFYPYVALPEELDIPTTMGNLSEEKVSLLEGLHLSTSVHAAPNYTYYSEVLKVDSDQKVTLCAYIPNDPQKKLEYQKKLVTLKEAFVYSLPILKQYFGRDLKNDVLIQLLIYPKAYGSATIQQNILNDDGSFSELSYIRIGDQIEGDLQQGIVAHELFHVFQTELGDYKYQGDRMWLAEATAVWAQDYVYPKTDTEHIYTKFYFNSILYNPLFSTASVLEYSSHVFIKFLVQYLNDETIPRKLLEEGLVSGKVRETIEKYVGNKHETFAYFTLYNWNKSPFVNYTDQGSFPTFTHGAFYEKIKKRKISHTHQVLTPVSFFPVDYKIDKDVFKIPRIRFSFDFNDGKAPSMMALIQTAKGWHYEDWTGLEDKEIIRLEGEDRVDRVVVLYYNPDFADLVKMNITVDTTVEENVYLSMTNDSTILFEDEGITNTYTSSYTALMKAEFDDVVKAYYPESIEANYHARSSINPGSMTTVSTGTLSRYMGEDEKNYYMYEMGEEILCQLWPYMNENYVDLIRTVKTGEGDFSSTEKTIPMVPEIIMHNLQFIPEEGTFDVEQGPLVYHIDYIRDKERLEMLIKYEGSGTATNLDSASKGTSKGTIRYIYTYK